MRWLHPSAYHTVVLILGMGLSSAAFAFNTFDLARLAMANLDYLTKYGLMALLDGGLVQSLIIALQGLFSLLLYLAFKAGEHELMRRWFRK